MNEDTRKQQGPDEFAKTGEHVIVVDEHSIRHHGLVTNGWGGTSKFPAINVVFVVPSTKMKDSYGQQKDHLCSLSHANYQPAPGRYWYKDAAWARPTERDGIAIHEAELQREAAWYDRYAKAVTQEDREKLLEEKKAW